MTDLTQTRATNLRCWHRNKSKYTAQQRQRYATDPELRKRRHEYMLDWRKRNPDKYEAQLKRKKLKGIRKRFAVLREHNFTCRYCGRKAPEVVLEIDHIVPKSKGGTNEKDNLTVACRDCNEGKSDVILTKVS